MFDPNHFGKGFHLPISISSIENDGPGACKHRVVTVDMDGETIVLHTDTEEIASMGGDDYKLLLAKCLLRRASERGVELDNMSGGGMF